MNILAARLSFLLAGFMTAWMARQWWTRGKKPHHAAWALGFLLYAAGTFVEAFLEWTPGTLRFYYFVAAFMTAAVLGQGTAYLLFSRRVAHTLAAVLAAGGLAALVACATVPLRDVALAERGVVDMSAFPRALRLATLPFNIYGGLVLAGGAAFSIMRYAKVEGGRRRALANVLILVGVVVIAVAGSATKGGHKEILLYAELAGLVLLAAGVYVAG